MEFSESDISAILLSLKVAFLSAVFSMPFAIATGYLIARKNFKGKQLIDGIINLPLVMPPITTGYLLLILLGRKSIIGNFFYAHFGISLAFTTFAAVLASVVVSFPLITRSIQLSFEMADLNLEKAAATLGAPPWAVFMKITLPLAMPGVFNGFVLGFARSLGEFGATITFAGNILDKTRTIPLAIFSYLEVPGKEKSAVYLVLISIIISLAAMMLSSLLTRKSKNLQ